MFLPSEFAFDMRNKIGGVSSYFFCYRAMSERVRFFIFYDMKRQCRCLCFPIVVATKGGKSLCWSRTRLPGRIMSHIINCKRKISPENFFIF